MVTTFYFSLPFLILGFHFATGDTRKVYSRGGDRYCLDVQGVHHFKEHQRGRGDLLLHSPGMLEEECSQPANRLLLRLRMRSKGEFALFVARPLLVLDVNPESQ